MGSVEMIGCTMAGFIDDDSLWSYGEEEEATRSAPSGAPPPEGSPDRLLLGEIGFLEPAKELAGLAIGLFNRTVGKFFGVGVGLWNKSHEGPMAGVQVAGLVNHSGGAMNGVQVAGLANIGRRASGVQLAGVTNVLEEVQGAQAAIAGNSATELAGVQLSPVFNYVGRLMRGAQVAFFANYVAGDAQGIQVAYAGNFVSGDMAGIQLGLLNRVEGDMRGIQIGILNVWDAHDRRCFSPFIAISPICILRFSDDPLLMY